MSMPEEVERIFKQRELYKQCRVTKESPEDADYSNNKDKLSRISELIKKLKS